MKWYSFGLRMAMLGNSKVTAQQSKAAHQLITLASISCCVGTELKSTQVYACHVSSNYESPRNLKLAS